MKFAYARTGGPLLDWSGVTPPTQSRAGETRSLGDFYPTTRNSGALRRYGGRGPRYAGAAIQYEGNRQLAGFYPTTRNSAAVRPYGGQPPSHSGSAVGYEHNRSLAAFYPTVRNSAAVRQYGGRPPSHGGSAVNYEYDRSLGDFNFKVPRPGAPEVVSGYEAPAPGAAVVHLGHGLSGFIPEGAARQYGQQMLGEFNVTGDTAPATTSLQDMIGSPMVKKAAVIASAYHGVKRHNGSVMWGLLWAIGAYIAPINGVSAVALATAQGFGKAK